MKKLVCLTMIIAAIVTVSFNQKVSAQNPAEITYQDFYDSLSPYGTWMQFYMQSSVIEKKLKISQYNYVLADILIGCIGTVVVAFFIIVACASTLHGNHIVINEAKDAALALKPLAGAFASQLFAFGLFIASIFSATILPLATAFYVCEAFGFDAGISKKWGEAQEFYTLYTAIIIISVAIILLPNAPLISISIWSQVINAILLPVVLICMPFKYYIYSKKIIRTKIKVCPYENENSSIRKYIFVWTNFYLCTSVLHALFRS